MKCYFSVNSLMLKSKKGRDLVSRIPSKLVLPESDGPFATLNSKPIMPWEAMNVCFVLSDIWKVSHQEAKVKVMENFDDLLSTRNEIKRAQSSSLRRATAVLKPT